MINNGPAPADGATALYVTSLGDKPALAWRDTTCPAPGAGEVRVAIAAATLSWGDVIQAQGRYVGGPTPPYVPGHDFAGRIVQVGAGVPVTLLDTRVFGLLPSGGALASHVVMPASWVSPTPDDLSDVAAAGIAASFFTADAALHFAGSPRADGVALIHAAAGGLGSAAIQLCRAYGFATVVATAGSAARRAFALECGADVVANYADFPQAVEQASCGNGADFILESVGGNVFDRSVSALAPFGRLLSLGASAAQGPAPLRMSRLWHRSLTIAGIHLTRWITDFPERIAPTRARVLDLLSTGQIRPLVDQQVSASEAAVAFQRLAARTVHGRIAVQIAH